MASNDQLYNAALPSNAVGAAPPAAPHLPVPGNMHGAAPPPGGFAPPPGGAAPPPPGGLKLGQHLVAGTQYVMQKVQSVMDTDQKKRLVLWIALGVVALLTVVLVVVVFQTPGKIKTLQTELDTANQRVDTLQSSMKGYANPKPLGMALKYVTKDPTSFEIHADTTKDYEEFQLDWNNTYSVPSILASYMKVDGHKITFLKEGFVTISGSTILSSGTSDPHSYQTQIKHSSSGAIARGVFLPFLKGYNAPMTFCTPVKPNDVLYLTLNIHNGSKYKDITPKRHESSMYTVGFLPYVSA